MARKAKMLEDGARRTGSIEHSLGSRKKATAYGSKIKHGHHTAGPKGHGFSKDAKK
jgi:hypothetical protein